MHLYLAHSPPHFWIVLPLSFPPASFPHPGSPFSLLISRPSPSMAPPYASRGVLTAFFTLVALCAASTTCTAGVDHPDSDLPGMPLLNVVSQAACGAMCDADPACSIWVYIAPGCQTPVNSESMCYLKQGSPPAVRKESCYCSGNGTHAPPPPPPPPDVPRFTLSNGVVAASLGSRGLVRVTAGAVSVAVTLDAWAVIVDAAVINSTGLPDPVATQAVPGGDVVYAYAPVGASPAYTVTVTYSAAPSGGAFLRKALTIASSTPSVPLVVASIAPFDVLSLQLNSAPVGAVYPSGALGTYGVFLRAADGSGLVAAAENPFLTPSAVAAFSPTGALVRVAYRPDMVWNQSTPRNATPAPFIADAGLIGLYMLSPNAVPPPLERDTSSRLHRVTRLYVAPRRVAAGSPDALATGHYAAHDTARGMLVEFEALGSGGALPVGVHAHRGAPAPDVWLNYAERDAFRALGEAAFNAAHYGGAEPLRVHIPWFVWVGVGVCLRRSSRSPALTPSTPPGRKTTTRWGCRRLWRGRGRLDLHFPPALTLSTTPRSILPTRRSGPSISASSRPWPRLA